MKLTALILPLCSLTTLVFTFLINILRRDLDLSRYECHDISIGFCILGLICAIVGTVFSSIVLYTSKKQQPYNRDCAPLFILFYAILAILINFLLLILFCE